MAAGDLLEAVTAGSRWLYAEPTADQVKEWFEKQTLHPGMTHAPYLGGIVVLAQEEDIKETVKNANDQTFVRESKRAAFTPYVKIDTRIRYFRDYVTMLNRGNRDEVVGVIEPAEVPRVKDPSSPFYNEHLPDGFTTYAVKNANDSVKRFVVATFQVAIYERQSYVEMLSGKPAMPILQGRGSKQVPTNYRNGWADDASLMKAETGAIGRALGVAGILTVGTGVASAEDMQEALSGGGGSAAAGELAGPELPPVVTREGTPVSAPEAAGAAPPAEDVSEPEPDDPAAEDERLRARAVELRDQLQKTDAAAWDQYVSWYNEERRFAPLDQLTGSALKGAVVKLERMLDMATQGAD